eukprot:1948055-Prymnesium_polylepis.1
MRHKQENRRRRWACVCWRPGSPRASARGEHTDCAARALLQGHLPPPSLGARRAARPRHLCRARSLARVV